MKRRKTKKEIREVDKLVVDVDSWWKKTFAFIRKTEVRTWKGVAILAFLAGVVVAIIWLVSLDLETNSKAMQRVRSPLMKSIKSGGCVADGILSNYGGKWQIESEMIKRSECRYLHRALETWAAPPDFDQARMIMNDIKSEKPDIIFGMFLAEAVNPKSEYYFPDERRNFNFPLMCRAKSQGFWGENTCKGYFGNAEYRKYLKYITRRAIDEGIQSFLIGQIYFQDNGTGMRSWAEEIVGDMRSYAAEKNREIVIGAQTNDIRDEKYLRIFDFIEGGVGLSTKGEIEDGPCFSRWWKKPGDRCWAFLWHDEFSQKANDVIAHLDWSGFYDDDMSTFARLDKEKREETMLRLHKFFLGRGVGFMLPYLAVINENNGSCFGPARNYYSASEKYSCRDEAAFNAILKKALEKNEAGFEGQDAPIEMTIGQKYRAEVRMKNTGTSTWKREDGFRLGSQNPQDTGLWGGRIDLDFSEEIAPGETAVFVFEAKAPEVPGTYDFQWRMVDEGNEWFGEKTENLEISVSNRFRTDEGETINLFPVK
jgi:hypothetical protein